MSSPSILVSQSAESDLQLSGRSALNTPARSELQAQEALEEITVAELQAQEALEEIAVAELQAQEVLEEIAVAIQQGQEEQETIQSIRSLNVNDLTGFNLPDWKARSCSLNLCQLAVVHGQSNLVGYLLTEWRGFLKKALYLSSCDVSSQSTPVLTACSASSPVVEQPQTDAHKEDVDVDAIMVNHPLHLACWLGHIRVLRSLTKVGVHVSSAKIQGDGDHDKRWQYDRERHKLQELMRSASTIITASTAKFQTPPRGLPVELAVSARSVSCLKHLLAKVFVHATVSRQYSHQCMEVKRKAVALYLACCFSAPQAVALLLPELTTEDVVQCVDARGQTPLHFAVWTGDTHTVRLLLEKGALVNARVTTVASCFHILYRSQLQPWNYDANTRLLLQHGALVNVRPGSQGSAASGSLQGSVSPLYALLEELMDATTLGWVRDGQRGGRIDKMAEGLWMYTQSQEPVKRNFSLTDYLTCLVKCLRLLLEAGANPNLLLPDSTGSVKSALELVITSKRDRLALQAPDVFFAVLSLLIDFTTPEVGINFYRHVANMAARNASLQIGVINLFLDNGYGADAVCQNMLNRCIDHTPGDALYPCVLLVTLAHKASIRGLAALKRVSLWHKVVNQDLTEALSPLLGSPVPSLRYSCKLAVLQQLGWRCSRVQSLPLPTPVKSYLLEQDYN